MIESYMKNNSSDGHRTAVHPHLQGSGMPTPVQSGGNRTKKLNRRGRWRLGDACIAYLAVFALAPLYIPFLLHSVLGLAPAHTAARGLLILSLTMLLTVMGLAVGIWVTYLATATPTTPLQSFYLTALFAASWYGLISGLLSPLWKSWSFSKTPSLAFGFLCLALASSFLGRLIAEAFKDRNLVPVAALVGALVDIWGVFFGTTHQIVIQHRDVVDRVSVHTPHVGIGPAFQLGPGDYVFIGILFALVHRFRLNPARTAWAMLALLSLTAFLVLHNGWSLPGIVPMALAVVLVNAREFKFQRSEVVAIGVVLILLAGGAFGWSQYQGHQQRTPARAQLPVVKRARAASHASPHLPLNSQSTHL